MYLAHEQAAARRGEGEHGGAVGGVLDGWSAEEEGRHAARGSPSGLLPRDAGPLGPPEELVPVLEPRWEIGQSPRIQSGSIAQTFCYSMRFK